MSNQKSKLVAESEIDFANFPITRYQGSKRKIVSWIYENIKELSFQSVLDGFGGSSTVSYLFKKLGKDVTYNDKLKFNALIGKAIIENQVTKLTDEDLLKLLQVHPNINYSNLIQKTFKNIYYLNKENRWLDLVTPNIVQMNHYQSPELDYKKAISYYALFQSCLIKRPYNLFHRKNLNIRTADVDRNFGNKSTWDRPFKHYLEKFANEANTLIFDSKSKCRAINESIFDLDSYGYDLVYLDPPYLRKNVSSAWSSYQTYYHFLEGLSMYDDWSNFIDYNKQHLPLRDDVNENDFTNANVKERFEEMIYKFRRSIIVISYKNGGNPSIDYIIRLMKKIKRHTTSRSIKYSYALNRQNGDAKYNREVLIIGI